MLDSELRDRAHLLAARRLSSRPGAAERFRQYLESPPGSTAWRFWVITMNATARLGPTGPGSHDADLLRFIDEWTQGDASPDAVAPLPVPANDAAPSPTAASKRAEKWTPGELAEMGAYRAAHGTEKTAERYGISKGRVRQLVPDKKSPRGYSAFNQTRE